VVSYLELFDISCYVGAIEFRTSVGGTILGII
jgi:hypothetical protein